MVYKAFFILICLITTNSLQARNLEASMNDFLDSLGMSSNVTESQRLKGQKANYFTGGSLYSRTKVYNTRLANIQLPKYEAGCGGIDLHLGSFSFINGDEIIATAKAIIANSPGLAFNTAMRSLSPSITNSYEWFQDKIEKLNQFSMNSCDIAQKLVSGAAREIGEHHCRAVGNSKGIYKDFAKAFKECTTDSEVAATNGSADDTERVAGAGPRNLVWEAIKLDDNDYKELLISLTGTIIYDGNNKSRHLPPLIISEDSISTLLGNSNSSETKAKFKVYDCRGDSKCLGINTDQTKEIEAARNFVTIVKGHFDSIQQKIRNEITASGVVELTAAEQSFIENESFPVYRVIRLQTLAEKSLEEMVGNLDVQEYIALRMLFKYLNNLLMAAEIAIEDGEAVLSQPDRDKVKERVTKIKELVQIEEKRVEAKFKNINILMDRYTRLEQQVNRDMGEGLLTRLKITK